MQTSTRGRLRQGHPLTVGGSCPRRSALAFIHLQFFIPAALFAGLGLWFASYAGTFVRAIHNAVSVSQVEWVEMEASASGMVSLAASEMQNIELQGFTPEVQRWSDSIERWSQMYEVPPLLIATVMQIESCGDAHALSPAGARGLFQVMPFHFKPGENGFDPETNAMRGLAYLRGAYDLGGKRVDLALAGYNGGHTQISRDPALWPEETRRYVFWGTGIWDELANGKVTSSTLDDWLDAGGKRLCQAALASLQDS